MCQITIMFGCVWSNLVGGKSKWGVGVGGGGCRVQVSGGPVVGGGWWVVGGGCEMEEGGRMTMMIDGRVNQSTEWYGYV
jgi:hypothetical protein